VALLFLSGLFLLRFEVEKGVRKDRIVKSVVSVITLTLIPHRSGMRWRWYAGVEARMKKGGGRKNTKNKLRREMKME